MDMERMKLRAAREAKVSPTGKRLSQQAVADTIGCSRDAYSMWECGTSDPQEHWIGELCTFFGKTSADLDLIPAARILTQEDIVKMLEYYDRRELIAMLQGLPVFAGVDLLAMIETPNIAPGEFLAQCNTAINACWQLLKHGSFGTVQGVLSTHMPKLIPLATVPDYQNIAAGLALQAKILEGKLAWHRFDLTGYDIASVEAVRFGKLTGNPYMHATALLYVAYSCIDHSPRRLEKAVKLFTEALRLIGGETSLLHADIHVSLAVTHALDGNSTETLSALDQAETILATNPQRTPSFLYGEHGLPEFAVEKGKAYLCLASHCSDNNYYQWAYDVFSSPDNVQVSTRRACENTILQADAARGLGDMGHFVELLERGLQYAIQLNSQKRISEAHDVINRIPTSWQKETPAQKLQGEISRTLVVARR
jgi:transcriptional regulator with XRE-family HTH domain